MRSILRSASEQLPSDAEKEAFGSQLSKFGVTSFPYLANPQTGASTAWITGEYSYFRQFHKCRIIKNRNIGSVIVKKAPYTIGLHPHFRTCYLIEIYTNGTAKPLWCGYFRRQDALYYALGALKNNGIPDEKVEDRLKK